MVLKDLCVNRFGFHELASKPSAAELRKYYSEKYYQECCGAYQKKYSPEELTYIRNKLEQKALVLEPLLGTSGRRFLDVGAGEGWGLSFFREKGWSCTGLDYSRFGCQAHNPACLDDLIVGDIYESLSRLRREKRRFELILLDNVLEHVLDPLALLLDLRELTAPGGVLVIEVPNDCSPLQLHLLEKGEISRPFWVAVPDHISYFNRRGWRPWAPRPGGSAASFWGTSPSTSTFSTGRPTTWRIRGQGRGATAAGSP